LLDWLRGTVLPAQKINPADLDLVSVLDDVEEIVEAIVEADKDRSGQEDLELRAVDDNARDAALDS
jgi:hypothetical protein